MCKVLGSIIRDETGIKKYCTLGKEPINSIGFFLFFKIQNFIFIYMYVYVWIYVYHLVQEPAEARSIRYPRTGATVSGKSSENWTQILSKNSQCSEVLTAFLTSVLPLFKKYCKTMSKKDIFPKPGLWWYLFVLYQIKLVLFMELATLVNHWDSGGTHL